MRIRVRMDLSKPLKRKMKLQKSGNDWFWITFKYENAPTFCFICGVMGHSEKFCSQLFEKSENDIFKPYGIWMRAPLRRQAKLIRVKWLRFGEDDLQANMDAGQNSQQQYPGNLAENVVSGAVITGKEDKVEKLEISWI